MKPWIKVGVVSPLLALGGTGDAVAGSDPFGFEATLYDEKVVKQATEDIGKMQEPEMRGFIRYWAECEDDPITEPALHSCNVAVSGYEIEFDNNRALDKWIIARKALRNLPAKFQVEGHESETVQESAERNLKQGRVTAALKDAIRDRLHTLKAAKR